MTARFLVLEGLDGSGTSTQAERLLAHLIARDVPVVRTNEPTGGPIGRIARQTLGAEPGAPAIEVLPWLFAADRADHLARTVRPALASGQTVISDRYLPSSLAYQSLTLPLEDVWALNQRFDVPDALLYVAIDVETALSRIDTRAGKREIYDSRERLTAVHAAYETVMAFLVDQGWPVTRIDGSQSIEAVTADLIAALPPFGPAQDAP
jgi:dTMP kinase